MFLSLSIYRILKPTRCAFQLISAHLSASVGRLGVHSSMDNVIHLNSNGKPKDGSQEDIARVARCLLLGNIVAVPTDTVYGLAVSSNDLNAVKKLYDIKGRNSKKAIAICVAELDEIKMWAKVTNSHIPILQDLLPGPVTVLLQRLPSLNRALNPDNRLVGVRIPQHQFMRNIVTAVGVPLALTSANSSGDRSTLSIEEFKELWPEVDLIVDGGHLEDSKEARLGSTVVDISVEGKFHIVRHGIDSEAVVKKLTDKHGLKQV